MIEVNESYGKAFDIAANKIKESNFLRVYSHYDADGVSSASIIASFLSRLNKRFHLTFLKQLDINEISKNNGELVILSDLGSDGLNPENFEVILVDHHEPPGNNKNIINLNPRSYGYDGTKEACSSTVAFILSLRINEENKDLYRFFLSGSIGDKQGVGGFKGLNKQIIERLGIKERKSLNLGPGKVADAITYSTDPFFVSLTGYEEKVIELLETLKIDKESKVSELSNSELEKIANILFLELLKGNTSKEGFENLVTDSILDEKSGLTVSHLSDIFDAAGRNGRMGLPVSYSLGDGDALQEMMAIHKDFKRKVIEEARKSLSSAYEMKNINVMEVTSESLTGIVASIGMIYFLNKDKPTVSYSKNANCKVSSRATFDLVGKGVNLSRALNIACSQVGGHGGGHDIAAGGTIPLEKINEFLLILDRIVGEQIGNTKESSKV